MNRSVLDYYHDSGRLPDRYYYQQINDPQRAYQQQRGKISNKMERIHYLLDQPEFKEEAEKAMIEILDSLKTKDAEKAVIFSL